MARFHKKHVTLETIISEFIECRTQLKKANEEIESLKEELIQSERTVGELMWERDYRDGR